VLTLKYVVLSSVSSDHSQASARPLLESSLFGVDGSLKRLEKVAAVILRATQGSLIRRALVFANNHDDLEEICRIFSRMILARYHAFRSESVPMRIGVHATLSEGDMTVPQQSGFIGEEPLPSKDDIMASQPADLFLALVKSSVVRHFRILYERNRRDREREKHEKPENKTQKIEPPEVGKTGNKLTPPGPDQTATAAPNHPTDAEDETRSENQPTLLSIDTNEYKKGIVRTDSGDLRLRDKRGTPISEAGVAYLPPAPKIIEGQNEAVCPICRQVFPADDLRGASWM
jgi:hypothetical protein